MCHERNLESVFEEVVRIVQKPTKKLKHLSIFKGGTWKSVVLKAARVSREPESVEAQRKLANRVGEEQGETVLGTYTTGTPSPESFKVLSQASALSFSNFTRHSFHLKLLSLKDATGLWISFSEFKIPVL